MAISPQEVLQPKSEAEAQLLAEVEGKIDAKLVAEFDGEGVVTYPCAKRWRPGFVQLLIQKYQDQGWTVNDEWGSGTDQGEHWLEFSVTQPDETLTQGETN